MKFIAAMMVFTSFSSFAATSDVLNLKGIVEEVLSIEVIEETIAGTLPLDITQTNTKVATVKERSNVGSGYKVTITSENNGALKRTGGTEIFPYSLKYDGVDLVLSSPVVQTNLVSPNFKASKAVRISYVGVDAVDMTAGTYTDNITFAIAPN